MIRPALRCFALAAIIFWAAFPSWGQKSGPGRPPSQPPSSGRGGASSGPGMNPNSERPAQVPPFVYGSIRTENGMPVPYSASVELRCGVQLVLAVHPNVKGQFDFNLQGGPQSDADMSAAVDRSAPQTINPSESQGGNMMPEPSGRELDDCELRISAPGYQPVSKVVMLNTPTVGGLNVGTVVLTPLSGAAAEVSASMLLVPAKARKEFEKGENDLRHNKLPSAQGHLQKAVAEYDKFAPAWDELGRVYFTNHQNDQAGQAYAKAIGADPQFVPGYVDLAQLQYEEGQFGNAAESAGKALALSPGLVPASYIEAAADLKLNRLDDAEKSARLAERGPHREIPQVSLLLADILMAKREYAGAVTEMQSYLKDYPQGQFAAEVRSRLPEVQKLAADSNAQQTSPQAQQSPATAQAQPSATSQPGDSSQPR